MTSTPNASLYVGDLSSDTTEVHLFDLFKTVGPVLSIRVCRDAFTRNSLGYAYVNFQNPDDAVQALKLINHQPVKGRRIRVMWCQRDPNLRKLGVGNVFIKNLHPSIDNETLYDTFAQFGNILSCKVAFGPDGQSRGFGFVHFENEDASKAAIEKVHGMLLKSLQVFVGPFVRRAARVQHDTKTFTNVYIKHLKMGITLEQLGEFFGQFGEIKSKALKADHRDRPFAFADYTTHEQALKVIDDCHDKFFEEVTEEDLTLYVNRFQKKSDRLFDTQKQSAERRARRIHEYSGLNLYVKNLDDSVDDAQLREAFAKFGNITSAKVMMTDAMPPISKGFGFVCFADAASANKAISDMNGFLLGDKPLYVNVAQRKEVRRSMLGRQFMEKLNNPAAAMQQQGGKGFQPMAPASNNFNQNTAQPMHPSYQAAAQQGGKGPTGKGQQPYQWPQYGQPSQQWPTLQQAYGAQQVPIWSQQAPNWSQQGPGWPQQGQAQGVPYMSNQRTWQHTPYSNRRPAARNTGPAAAPGMPGHWSAVTDPNLPQPLAAQPMTGSAAPASTQTAQKVIVPNTLGDMTPEQQKSVFGEQLFAKVSELEPEYAPKITGMFLQLSAAEIMALLQSDELLGQKVTEGMMVLKEHEESAGSAK